MPKQHWIAAVCICTALSCTGTPSSTPWEDTAEKPNPSAPPTDTLPQFYDRVPSNLLFLSIDTFRRDHMRRYGHPNDVVPFLDDLAENGFSLDDHTQCSNWTFHSTTCTLMGRNPIEDGWAPRLGRVHRTPVPENTPLLASYLGDAGFYSILVSNNNWLSMNWGNAQGYDRFRVPPNSGAASTFSTGLDELLTARDEGRASRWFLHLHLLEPHAPYDPPDEYLEGIEALPPTTHDLANKDIQYELRDGWGSLEEEERAVIEQHLRFRYEAEMKWMDEQIRLMFADLGARGLLDDTLVVVWTDHGEQFWEHGRHTHAYALYPEENDALAFFWATNIVPGAWTGPTTAIDLVPTLLGLYGIDRPDEVTGIPLGEAAEDRARVAFTLARSGPIQSVRKGSHRLQYRWSGGVEVYDRATDPTEQNNLYDINDATTLDLWNELLPWIGVADAAVEERSVTWPSGLPRPK